MTRLVALAVAALVTVAAPSADAGAGSGASPRLTGVEGVGASAVGASGALRKGLPERAFVLLHDNRVLLIDTRAGRVIRRRTLAPKPMQRVSSGRRLAVSADGQTLFVLVAGAPDSVAVLDARTLLARDRVALEPGVLYRALVLAPTGDRLYVFGNRPGRVVDTVNRLREEAAVGTSVELATQTVSTVTVREAGGRSWFVYWAAFSGDGSRLVITYHGGCNPDYIQRCTGGADRLDVSSGALERCQGQEYQSSGCSGQVHGMIEPFVNGFLAARGLPAVAVLDRDLRQVRLVQTRLRTHLMDFALGGGTLYVVGGCAKGTGVRAVSIASGTSRRVGPRSLCGERIAATQRTLAISNAGRFATRSVSFVDRRTGRVIGRVSVGGDPVDVVAG